MASQNLHWRLLHISFHNTLFVCKVIHNVTTATLSTFFTPPNQDAHVDFEVGCINHCAHSSSPHDEEPEPLATLFPISGSAFHLTSETLNDHFEILALHQHIWFKLLCSAPCPLIFFCLLSS